MGGRDLQLLAGLAAGVVGARHHDDPGQAFAISRLTDLAGLASSPIGIFRDVQRPAYDDLARDQLSVLVDPAARLAQLQDLITGADTWQV